MSEEQTTEVVETVVAAPVNPLEMSDADVESADFSAMDEALADVVEEESEGDLVTEAEAEGKTDEEAEEEEDTDPEAESPGEGDDPAAGSEEGTEADPEGEGEAETEELETDEKPTAEAQLEELFKPFKANGREMSVDTIEEAKRLMSMGANYNKKMAGLKPSLKIVKMLDNNGLLDENKLSFLIDLDKKNPDAIAKLLKDSGVDPLDINTEGGTEYKPNTYTVGDKEVDLEAALSEISDTPTYQDTIDTISNKWDVDSQQEVIKHPEVIGIINEHKANGVFDHITAIVDKQRALGNIPAGVSDLAAYKQVGDQMMEQQRQAATKPASVKPTTGKRKPTEAELKTKKRAASSTKAVTSSTKNAEFNPLGMSDEEFEKAAGNYS